MSAAMAEVYGATTDKIMVNLARYFKMVKPGQPIPGAFEYQARMLAQMGKVNSETVKIIAESLGGYDAALRNALSTAIVEALRNEEPVLRKAAQKGLLMGEAAAPPTFTPNQMQAFRAYYQQSADKLNLVNTVMLESTQSAYASTVSDVTQRLQRTQSILNTATGEVVTGVSSYNTAMRDAVRRMVDNGLTGFVDHGGHRWSPEAYVAMDIKTTMFNTARSAVWERNEEYGNDLYQVSSHNGARPLCFPWQQKVISRTDMSREVEDLDGNKIHVYAQSETSYGQAAGLFGVNCGHYAMVFIPGFSTLKGHPQDEEENEKTYAESQEQRALERKLREEKRDLEVLKAQGADETAIKEQQAKVRKASRDIDDFCDETGRTRRRDREGAPVNAKFPAQDSYDAAAFPTEQRDRMQEFFQDGNQQSAPRPTVVQPAQQSIIQNASIQATEQKQTRAVYTQEEKNAVEYYVSGDGMWVNQYLRDPSGFGELSDGEKELIDLLDSATKREIVQDKILYRAVDAESVFGKMTDIEFDNLRGAIIYDDKSKQAQAAYAKAQSKIGQTITEKGFMSTTRDKEIAYQWSGYTGSTKDIALELRVQDGIRGFDVEKFFEVDEQQQREVLLQRGLKYVPREIVKREDEEGSAVIAVIADIFKK
jgi:hypothetical protein